MSYIESGKIYVGKRNFSDMVSLFKKYKEEKYLLPSSDSLKPLVPDTLDKLGIDWTRGIFYKTVISDLSDLRDVYYDILVFFSPSGIESLLQNFLISIKRIPELPFLATQR